MITKKLKIAVLCDGGGLARKGLEQAGHTCTGVEIDPTKHAMSKHVGSGNCINADIMDLDDSFFNQFDAVWASPPCQMYSDQRTKGLPPKEYGNPDLLPWSLSLKERYPHLKALWVENVFSKFDGLYWGIRYNAAQFTQSPLQRRRRLIGGDFKAPYVYRDFKYDYKEYHCAPPACLASEIGQGGINSDYSQERRKFTRWYLKHYNRKPTIADMATAQGFIIPKEWVDFSIVEQSQAIGNGVPVYMARAFGEAYSKPETTRQLPLFS